MNHIWSNWLSDRQRVRIKVCHFLNSILFQNSCAFHIFSSVDFAFTVYPIFNYYSDFNQFKAFCKYFDIDFTTSMAINSHYRTMEFGWNSASNMNRSIFCLFVCLFQMQFEVSKCFNALHTMQYSIQCSTLKRIAKYAHSWPSQLNTLKTDLMLFVFVMPHFRYSRERLIDRWLDRIDKIDRQIDFNEFHINTCIWICSLLVLVHECILINNSTSISTHKYIYI